MEDMLQTPRHPLGNPDAPAAGRGLGRRLIGGVDRFNDAILLFLSLVLGVLACLGAAQVVWRYVLNQPLVWSEEAIRYALIWSVFLGSGVAVRRGLLASVELVAQLAPPKLRKLFAGFSLLVCGLFWLTLLFFGVAILESVRGMTSGSLEMPMPLVYMAIPVGAALALINTIVVAFDPPAPATDLHLD